MPTEERPKTVRKDFEQSGTVVDFPGFRGSQSANTAVKYFSVAGSAGHDEIEKIFRDSQIGRFIDIDKARASIEEALKAPDAALAQPQNPQDSVQGREMSDPTREEIKALIGESAANHRTELTRLEGKIDTLTATLAGKIDSLKDTVSAADQYNRNTRWVLVGVIVASIFALAALIVGLATYGDALFGRGMNVRDVIHSVIKEQQDLAAPPVSQPPASPSSTQPPTTSKSKDTK